MIQKKSMGTTLHQGTTSFTKNEKKFAKEVGKRIRALRTERKWSQKKLADIAKMTDKYLSRVENGESGISAYVLTKLALALNTHTDVLCGISSSDQPASYIKLHMEVDIPSSSIQTVMNIFSAFDVKFQRRT